MIVGDKAPVGESHPPLRRDTFRRQVMTDPIVAATHKLAEEMLLKINNTPRMLTEAEIEMLRQKQRETCELWPNLKYLP